ncbi:MAG: NAD(P)H-dependent oxidoreductase subunit E [Planctomycetes bacterium]|nr:NAD(P)H-dependent oxidoreductase subunit E [Planctomycetota bacterium]
MELLRELTRLQAERGFLSDETLRELSEQKRVPLYRFEGLVSFYPHFRRTPPPRASIHVCRDVCCAMSGGAELRDELRERLQTNGDVELHEVSCLGRCDSAPAVSVNDEFVTSPSPVSAAAILARLEQPENQPTDSERPPSKRKWSCDPYSSVAEHYGTVKALIAAGSDVAETCVSELKSAGLRGMGGAGFSAGRKWELVAAESAEPKYVICNADESEPGTFKDRVILDELPHLVIEGMLLAALTVAAERGIVFIRHEYAPEQKSLQAALVAARDAGILGENAAGSGRRFEIEIFTSPGGYILGEETALLETLEDKRGEPRNKPPYPGTCGLWGKPTLINNVETFAWATAIVHRGSAWWNGEGTNGSTGRKFVSVSGDVTRPGVYEIPLGTTVNELIAIAGGVRNGKPLLAFLPGGASSNFLPADKAETPLDFAAMQQAGSMLGTGAVIVISEGRDLFSLATNLVRFFRNESCGKCVPCRVGSEKAVQLLEGVQQGEISSTELNVLPELGETLEQTSICGLGQVALNPILSMLKHFPDTVPT